MGTPTFSFEVVTLPVTNIDRALRFYVDQVGFRLDVDYSPNDAFRVVQLTPPAPVARSRLVRDSPTHQVLTSQGLSRRHGPRSRADPSARMWCERQ